MTTNESRPWYREPFMWMVVLVPLSSVLAGILMIYLAISSFDGMVVDDYYKYGKEINRNLARDQTAARFGLSAELEYKADKVHVRLSTKTNLPLPDSLRLGFYHATRAGQDQVINLVRTPEGVYFGLARPFAPGRWNVQLETESWRLMGSMTTPAEQASKLAPSVSKTQ